MQIQVLRDAARVESVGGKAALLGYLFRIGVNVPDGFIITSEAVVHWDDTLSKQALKRFDKLGAEYVAVRSSATVEDSADATWAGQFDTYLFVNRDQLIDKIKECIKSTLSVRSMAYRKAAKQTIAPNIAVLVQIMIPAEVSGVCFSVHPVTHNVDQVVIEAVYGLGESVVSGEVTPDNYIVSKQHDIILSKSVADQKNALTYSEAANNIVWQATKRSACQKLSDLKIMQLTTLVGKIEKHFGFPVDVEWSLCKGNIYILQSRPITTLG